MHHTARLHARLIEVVGVIVFIGVIGFHGAAAGGEIRGRVLAHDGEPAPHVAVLVDDGATAPPREVRLEEAWLSFVPKTQVAPIGSTLVVHNGDDESHTVHGWLGPRTLFNLASVPARGEARATLDRPGVVTLTCELHDEMRAFVVVTRRAHAAVTGADGRFVVGDVAPGRHRVLAVWDAGPGRIHPAPKDGEEPGVAVDTTELPSGELVLRLPERARAVAAPPRAIAPVPGSHHHGAAAEASRLDGPRRPWPRGLWVYLAVAIAIAAGFAVAIANLRFLAWRGWSRPGSVLMGCGLAFAAALLIVAGLHVAVATALGFGIFFGSVVFAAGEV